jgi:hypothetical protein
MAPETMQLSQLLLSVLSAFVAVASVALAGFCAWLTLKIRNEILQMRIYVGDNFVRKTELTDIVARLQKLIDKLDAKLEGNRLIP